MAESAKLSIRWFKSSPMLQKLFRCGVMAARRSPKPLVGVRFPPPEPIWYNATWRVGRVVKAAVC